MDDVAMLAWIDKGKNVATALVAIGVAAEFAFGWVEGPIHKRLSDAQNSRIVEAEARAAEANRAAAEANLARVKLEERLAPRHLSSEQQESLSRALRSASPKGLVTITCVLGDGEGLAFASELDAVLKGADWPTTGVNQGVFAPGGNPMGLSILVHAAATAPAYAVVLQSALLAAGVRSEGIELPGVREGIVELLVGNKRL